MSFGQRHRLKSRVADLLTLGAVLGLPGAMAAQEPRKIIAPVNYECPACKGERRFWIAMAEVIGMDVALNLLNQAVKEGDEYAVGFDSWKTNFREGWNFDDNNFSTNQFAHPYNGSVYFSSARSNGYDYWSSIPFTALGSFIWEYMGERNRPALNDFLNTTIGGIGLGELTFQITNLVLDNRATGKHRTWLELAGLAINPARGVNRLMSGDWSRVGPNPPDRDPEALSGTLKVGARMVGDNDGFDNAPVQFAASFDFDKGDPLEQPYTKPFDTFGLTLQLNGSEKQFIGRVSGAGRLYRTALTPGPDTRHAFVVSQHYDYFNTNAFELGGQSVTGAILSRFPMGEKFALRTTIGPRAVLFGAVNSEFVDGPNRNYDFGSGLGVDVAAALTRATHRWLQAGYHLQWMHNVNGLAGTHTLHEFSLEADIPVTAKLGVGGELFFFHRRSSYRAQPDVTQDSPELRAYLTWRIE